MIFSPPKSIIRYQQKINYFANELTEMDRLFSHTISYELPDPGRNYGSGTGNTGAGWISNTKRSTYYILKSHVEW